MADSPDFQRRVQEALENGLPIPDFPDVSPLKGLVMAYGEAVKQFEQEGFARNEALYLVSAMFNGNPGFPPRA